MNTQFLMTTCDINTICIYVTIVVLGCAALNVFRSIDLSWLEHRNNKNENKNPANDPPEGIAYKQELERQDRVRALLKEIASISSDKIVYDETKEKKGYYEKYNDTEANNLFQLYQKLDKYIIIKEIADGEQQQS